MQSATFSRIEDLLTNIGIQDRIATKQSLPANPFVKIEYDAVFVKLNHWIERSKDYLCSALRQVLM